MRRRRARRCARAGSLPDVVLMDSQMPDRRVSATRQWRARPAAAARAVLTTFDLDGYVYGALRAGAAAFC